MTPKKVCPNFNHGRSLIAVRHCPQCGERFNSSAPGSCDDDKHKSRRKDRHFYCVDCGKNLKENS